ncbi:Retrovirus-related Pol polyprotein from transposon RE2, partial [Linum perenne]
AQYPGAAGPLFQGPPPAASSKGLLPFPQTGRQARPLGPGVIFCFNCHGMGHHFRQCPSPRQQAHSQPTSHFTYSPEPHPVDSWTLDSGANHHLTNNLANLHFHSEYQGTDQVHLTNGFDDQKGPSTEAGVRMAYMLFPCLCFAPPLLLMLLLSLFGTKD